MHHQNLPQGLPIKFHDTDYLEVEDLPLPVIDTSLRYLIRFSKPLAMILDETPIRISIPMAVVSSDKDLLPFLAKEALNRWKKAIHRNTDYKNLKPEAKVFLDKLRSLEEVKLVELQLTRKQEQVDFLTRFKKFFKGLFK